MRCRYQISVRTTSELIGLGTKPLSIHGDLRSKAYCENLIDTAISHAGRLDVLVNNANIITRGIILETGDERRSWFRRIPGSDCGLMTPGYPTHDEYSFAVSSRV
ncbi:SDR family NAD(P)-dependent oxidoreductase [Mesorhizobium sp. LNHC221B00]|uniref:SDR family NAD(P)-dependent oxidoreductase n=1 Tax=Mesorhizobium sp. LNHC221B00 TaxID=1287233 RepID=UPI001FD8C635|nr:SDR family NAD(P)-dependent oxidoreductase [Mesorhizobium sp. LNHC221B00]